MSRNLVNTCASSSTFEGPATPTLHMASMCMAPTSAPSVMTTSTPPATAHEIELRKILYIHTTPYSVDGWTAALSHCNILEDFPNLAHDIKLGSPIGNPPPEHRPFSRETSCLQRFTQNSSTKKFLRRLSLVECQVLSWWQTHM